MAATTQVMAIVPMATQAMATLDTAIMAMATTEATATAQDSSMEDHSPTVDTATMARQELVKYGDDGHLCNMINPAKTSLRCLQMTNKGYVYLPLQTHCKTKADHKERPRVWMLPPVIESCPCQSQKAPPFDMHVWNFLVTREERWE